MSVGARKNAYSLLVEIGNAFLRFCGNTKGEDKNKYISVMKIKIYVAKWRAEIIICHLSCVVRCHKWVFRPCVHWTYWLCNDDHLHSSCLNQASVPLQRWEWLLLLKHYFWAMFEGLLFAKKKSQTVVILTIVKNH